MRRRHRLLFLTVALLPLSYIPFEIDGAARGFAPVLAVMIGVLAFQYDGALSLRVSRVELAAIVFALFAVFRLAFDADADAASLAVRQTGQIVAGLVLFRLARREDLRPTIMSGLAGALGLMVFVELSQVVRGLGPLQAEGYTTENGFNFYTEAGAFRPFSTFRSPTVFGGYLAMLGFVVAFAHPRRFVRIGAWTVMGVGLIATETRAAWVAVAVALALMGFRRSRLARLRTQRTLAMLLGLSAVAVVFLPGAAVGVLDRLATVTDQDFGSNSARIDLWTGTWEHIKGHPLGSGADVFKDELADQIGVETSALGHPHNNYLQIGYSYGFTGIVLFGVLLLAMGRSIRRASLTESEDPHLVSGAYCSLVVWTVDSLFETTWTSFNIVATLFLLVGLGSVTWPRSILEISHHDVSAVETVRSR